jgi:hypothetical protein
LRHFKNTGKSGLSERNTAVLQCIFKAADDFKALEQQALVSPQVKEVPAFDQIRAMERGGGDNQICEGRYMVALADLARDRIRGALPEGDRPDLYALKEAIDPPVSFAQLSNVLSARHTGGGIIDLQQMGALGFNWHAIKL